MACRRDGKALGHGPRVRCAELMFRGFAPQARNNRIEGFRGEPSPHARHEATRERVAKAFHTLRSGPGRRSTSRAANRITLSVAADGPAVTTKGNRMPSQTSALQPDFSDFLANRRDLILEKPAHARTSSDVRELEEIAAAFARIRTRRFGRCEACARRIAPNRLRLHPYARLCPACAESGLSVLSGSGPRLPAGAGRRERAVRTDNGQHLHRPHRNDP